MKVRAFTALIITVIVVMVPIKLQSQDPETFCVLHNFGAPNSKDAVWPTQPGSMALAPDGSVWTTVNQGGAFGYGAVIKVDLNGTYSKVADFNLYTTGAGPQGGLVYGNNSYMYGTTYSGGKWGAGTIFRISIQGGDPEVLYDFRNGRPTGIQPKQCTTNPVFCKYSPEQRRDMSASYPISSPVLIGGNLYGVTSYSNNQQFGTLYSIPRDTAPRSNTFTALTPEDGDEKFRVLCMLQPSLANDPDMKSFRCNTAGTFAGTLIASPDGTLYGTTMGLNGSVFKATTSGAVTSLHEFKITDGSKPLVLMYASDSNLYGTTSAGGSLNWGVLYKIDPRSNSFSILTDFPKAANNAYVQGNTPVAGVVEGPDHNLYGALAFGGQYGRGLLYRIAMDGSDYRILHEFDAAPTGRKPSTIPMIIGSTIYGTTYQGGTYDSGVLYRLRTNRVAVTGGVSILNDGMIEVRAGARATQGGDKEVDDGISVTLKCTNDPHFVQFIYREVIQPYSSALPPGAEAFPNGKLLDNSFFEAPCCQTSWGDPYQITTLLTDLHWNPDAPKKPNPFFEAGHSAELDCHLLTLFDRPQLGTAYFDLGHQRVVRAVVRDYAICGGKVQRQVTWISDQTLDALQQPHWTYHATLSAITNNKIPDYFLCLLKNKGYDLPAGQSVSAGVDCAQLSPAILNKP